MSILSGLGARARGLFSDTKGPWGPTRRRRAAAGRRRQRGPWGEPPKRRRRSSPAPSGNVASFEDFLRRSRARFGGDGGGGGFPGRPDRSIFMWALLALVLVWLVFTTFHSIAPEERGVVTRFGRY